MPLRRNVITAFIWIAIVSVIAVHLIWNGPNEPSKIFSQQSITQLKTILKRSESDKNSNHPNNERTDETIVSDYNSKSDLINHVNGQLITNASFLSEIKQLKNEIDIREKKIQKLKDQNQKLIDKEKQFKNLARRLAVKLKGKESGTLPKLDPSIPWIFSITPTNPRYTQKAELIRLSQTLQHVTNFHWILIEDSKFRTNLVSKLLQESGLSFTHLNVRTSWHMQKKKGEKYNKHHRGVEQRNAGLKWLRDNVNPKKTPGVVYFMDDDNTYHKKIFDEMRWTHHVSVWPVGLSGGARWAGPVVSNGKVTSFHTNWAPDRSFPLDMAGFAVNLNLLLKEKPKVVFDINAKRGYLEPTFLESITTIDQLEPLANNCTEVLVWHTRTEVPVVSIKGERELIKLGKPSNPSIEV
ncbi:galactosylgalactosylxylosylprotein 3-beta-glucuronosyltransferase 3 [Hydra vulgaris]|uniref:Galactosylgalactosylxylosylprotein 3-beta-glucuronosyltransferase n=1 Tax=Hydra vulgaris TaxID=6087 RepID=T2MHG9_HYDVU|nr:galactosylgalactosylxylosylprotein 3-beta-glucuronosyltransferase 3 [Hydra vulgaris]